MQRSTPVRNIVPEIPAAAPEAAVAHFESLLRFETDCWDVHESLKAEKPGFLLLDVRSAHSYAAGHVERAINLPHAKINERSLAPYPADTLFVPERLQHADCVLAMYHDQGLPVLKYASFGRGVNVTLGLPFVRTSVDHGTALDLAGTGRADPGSLIEAVRLAIDLASAA